MFVGLIRGKMVMVDSLKGDHVSAAKKRHLSTVQFVRQGVPVNTGFARVLSAVAARHNARGAQAHIFSMVANLHQGWISQCLKNPMLLDVQDA